MVHYFDLKCEVNTKREKLPIGNVIDFDVTESEVNYYISSHSDIMKRIEKSFQRL